MSVHKRVIRVARAVRIRVPTGRSKRRVCVVSSRLLQRQGPARWLPVLSQPSDHTWTRVKVRFWLFSGWVLSIALLIWCYARKGYCHPIWLKSNIWIQVSLIQIKQTLLLLALNNNEIESSTIFPVKLLGSDTFPSDTVRNLGVVFDSDFIFHQHISQVCKSSFYHIRDLRRIRRHISIYTAKTISTALISSRLEYCNSLLNNIAKEEKTWLNSTDFKTVWHVWFSGRLSFPPSLPLLKQLQWLPVSYRINFKLPTLTYRALSTQQPLYLASLLHL